MRKFFLYLTAAAALGGCTSDWDNGKAAGALTAIDPQRQATPAAALTGSPQRAVNARLPDRGDLIAYDRTRPPVRRAAFTYHAINLSEDHALNAAHRGGKIEIDTPAGKSMSFAYDRHVDHGDGNWTWVGRTKEGLDAVITFGPEAVIGRISQANTESLQLAFAKGRSWLIEADPSKLRHPGSGRALNHDMMIAPKVAIKAAQTKRSAKGAVTANATTNAVAAATGPSDTVDVVLGYTPGLVAQNGNSVSAVVTLLTNRIELTNQAFASSLVTPRVRLVNTVQVNYTDTNSNSIALDQLSGQSCTPTACSSIPVPAELQPLRNAREQFGGDIVSLVRPLKEPEHGGCGVAWLLGPNNTAIDNTDAPFAYSVIGNGSDMNEGDGFTYSCPAETLAHEMAHNMGQQHNVEDSDSLPGTHTYSYGFREAASNGFYTIMAYPVANSTQFIIPYFGNPNVNYLAGRPTGTATADNARSLNQSMLLVAQFRATVVPFLGRTPIDINRDGRSDIMWKNSGSVAYWLMNGATTQSTGFIGTVGAGFNVVAAGDFNGDGAVDLGWSNGNQLIVSLNNGSGTYTNAGSYFYGPEWQPYASADINSDGKADILWRQGSSIAHWIMNGGVVTTTGFTGNAGAGFSLVAAGDFDGNGSADLALASGSQIKFWINNGSGTFTQSTPVAYGGGWQPFATADFNGDGKADVMWRLNSSIAIWQMNGTTVQSSGFVADAGAGFTLAAAGDYNGDGVGDLLFANGNQMKPWLSQAGGTAVFAATQFYGGGWQPFDPTLPAL